MVDYAQIQNKYLSFFLNEKLATKFQSKLESLPSNLQNDVLLYFTVWRDVLGDNLSKKEKNLFVLTLYQVSEKISQNNAAQGRFDKIIKKFPNLSGTTFDTQLASIVSDADYVDRSHLEDLSFESKLADLRIIIAEADKLWSEADKLWSEADEQEKFWKVLDWFIAGVEKINSKSAKGAESKNTKQLNKKD